MWCWGCCILGTSWEKGRFGLGEGSWKRWNVRVCVCVRLTVVISTSNEWCFILETSMYYIVINILPLTSMPLQIQKDWQSKNVMYKKLLPNFSEVLESGPACEEGLWRTHLVLTRLPRLSLGGKVANAAASISENHFFIRTHYRSPLDALATWVSNAFSFGKSPMWLCGGCLVSEAAVLMLRLREERALCVPRRTCAGSRKGLCSSYASPTLPISQLCDCQPKTTPLL